MRSGFSTAVGAAFVASTEELRAALPGWRVPLAKPIRRKGRNPFTGEPMWIESTRDPGSDTPAPVPRRLPFECIRLPSLELWEACYLALDLALSREPGLDAAAHGDDWLDVAAERGLCEEALYGGMDNAGDPRFLWIVPARITSRLAAIRTEDIDAELREWNRRSPERMTEQHLEDLVGIASAAVAQRRSLFLWLEHPLHRADSGRP